MSSLRILFVDHDSRGSEQVCSALIGANHLVLPASSLDEAEEALSLQKFDAVLLGRSLPADGLPEFSAKLRQIEQMQRSADHIPILCLSPEPPDASSNPGRIVDAYLSEPFEPATFAEAVNNLAKAVNRCASTRGVAGTELPVFELDEFHEQMGGDPELAAEIIDLFFSESEQQMPAMRAALARHDYSQLRPLAHTIKGSFGSLHAPCARARAQQLETAAAHTDAETCNALLDALEADLEALKAELLALRANGSR